MFLEGKQTVRAYLKAGKRTRTTTPTLNSRPASYRHIVITRQPAAAQALMAVAVLIGEKELARRGACRIASALPDAARPHLNQGWQSHGKYHEAHGKEIQSAHMCAEKQR